MADVEVQRDGGQPAAEPPASDADHQPETPRPPGRPRLSYFRRHPKAKWVILAILIALGIAAYFFWQWESGHESTDDAQIEGHIDPISARVGGHVTQINFDNNQYVQAGTVLVQIDPRDSQVALDRAEAALANAQAAEGAAQTNVPIQTTSTGSQVSTAQAGLQQARANLAAAQKEVDAAQARATSASANLNEAQANYTKAAADVKRYQPLVAKDEISQQMFQTAVTAADAAKAGVDAARAAVAGADQAVAVARSHVAEAQAGIATAQANVRAASSAPQQVAISEAQAKAAAARVQQAEAAVEQARLNLQYTTVTAPVSGIADKRSAEMGENVQPGQPLLAIVPLNNIWVTALFKETQMHYMQPGQKVMISVDAYGGRDYNGYVESIAGATGETFSLLPPENASGNYVKVVQRIPVRIRFDNGQDPKHLLRPGMSVEATVYLK